MKPSQDMFSEIAKEIEAREKGVHHMKLNTGRRTRGLLVACVLIVLTTATCFAASQIMSYTGGGQKVFDNYPSEKQMAKTAGFLPKYIEEFRNGYVFADAGIGSFDGLDADGKSVETIKNTSFGYEKAGKKAFLNVDESVSAGTHNDGKQVQISANIMGNYMEYMNKIMPADYVMTEQDLADEANGTYVFSFSDGKAAIQHVQCVSWIDSGMQYSISCYDDGLTKDDLVEMAREIIKK
ncbi:MAG: hypothetical protein RR361_04885 [Anaerovorax sp.]